MEGMGETIYHPSFVVQSATRWVFVFRTNPSVFQRVLKLRNDWQSKTSSFSAFSRDSKTNKAKALRVMQKLIPCIQGDFSSSLSPRMHNTQHYLSISPPPTTCATAFRIFRARRQWIHANRATCWKRRAVWEAWGLRRRVKCGVWIGW